MKKSTLLSLATAGAIVATSVGTFAVWDTLEATSTGSITVASPSVIVKATNMDNFTNNDSLGATEITYTGTAKFNVEGADKLTSLKLTPSVTAGDGTDLTDKVSIAVEQTGETLTGDSSQGYVDSKLAEGDNEYTVKVTVNDSTLSTKELNVSVKAEATPKE